MNYSLLTEQQFQKRFNSLPENIKDVLTSENNAETIRRICQSHYLKKEKTLMIEQLIGLVLLGFVPLDKMSQEISENLHLDNKNSNDIADEFDRKIFTPIRDDLEKNYTPLEQEFVPAKMPIDEKPSFAKATDSKEIVDLRQQKASADIHGQNTDKHRQILSQEEQEKNKPEIIPPKETVSGVEPLKIEKVESPQKSVSSPHESVLMPKIIHEEKKITPLTNTKQRSLSGLFGFLKKEKQQGIKPATKAKIEIPREIPKTAPTEAPKLAKIEIPKPRVVHYGGLQTPSPFGKNIDPYRPNTDSYRPADKKEENHQSTEIKQSAQSKPPGNLPIKNQYKSVSSQHESVSEEEDVIDLRTFELKSKIKNQNAK
ncbi:MAG TPA: hypothetical protein ENH26_00790 [Candidatus Wolfebacteria bacterium]|nr:hypothetical protein [Candidatus Wolfebacteria bacterium]